MQNATNSKEKYVEVLNDTLHTDVNFLTSNKTTTTGFFRWHNAEFDRLTDGKYNIDTKGMPSTPTETPQISTESAKTVNDRWRARTRQRGQNIASLGLADIKSLSATVCKVK